MTLSKPNPCRERENESGVTLSKPNPCRQRANESGVTLSKPTQKDGPSGDTEKL